MRQRRKSTVPEKRNTPTPRWRALAVLLGPSVLLLPILVLYLRFKGTLHFFLHTLIGWDAALVLLLAVTYFGRPRSRWDGFLPLALTLFAMTPDFIYSFGPFHRDWMDVFLFHVALDETLPVALVILAVLWAVLLLGYLWFRTTGSSRGWEASVNEARGPHREHTVAALSVTSRRQLGFLLAVSVIALAVLGTLSVVTERSAHTPLVQVGQSAPDFALQSTSGSIESLAGARGHPVVLAFVPSVLCDFCREQLRTIQTILPELHARGIVVFSVSTDTSAVQQAAAARLDLAYPILSEAPTRGQHPVGSAYGFYHVSEGDQAPVDANAVVVIDAKGIVRVVHVEPDRAMSVSEILALVDHLSALDAHTGTIPWQISLASSSAAFLYNSTAYYKGRLSTRCCQRISLNGVYC